MATDTNSGTHTARAGHSARAGCSARTDGAYAVPGTGRAARALSPGRTA
ncbi:hypothetical protein ACVWXU_005176 [Streptomyces sp. TE33382]